MTVLFAVDAYLLVGSLQHTLKYGRTMVARFAFEFTVLLIELCSHLVRFTLHVVDVACAGRWEGKAMVAFYAELVADALQLIVYLAFFVHVISFYPLPIHILRDLYVAATRLQRRVLDFMRYRQVVATMAQLFADASAEELASADATCIICREEMTAAKKLACGHIFHARCLQSWLKRQLSCPTCRAPVDVSPTAHRTAAAAAAAAANRAAAVAAAHVAAAAHGGAAGHRRGPAEGRAAEVAAPANGAEGGWAGGGHPLAGGERRRVGAQRDAASYARHVEAARAAPPHAPAGGLPADAPAEYEDWARRAQALQAHRATVARVLRNLDGLIARNAAGWPPVGRLPAGAAPVAGSPEAAAAAAAAAATAAARAAPAGAQRGGPAGAPSPAGLSLTQFQWPHQQPPPGALPREGGPPPAEPAAAASEPPAVEAVPPPVPPPPAGGPPASLPTAALARHTQQLAEQQARLYSMRRRGAPGGALPGGSPPYATAPVSAATPAATDGAAGAGGPFGGGAGGAPGGGGGGVAGRLRHLHYQAPHHPYQPPPLWTPGRGAAGAGAGGGAAEAGAGSAEAAAAAAAVAGATAAAISGGRWLGASAIAAPPAPAPRPQPPAEARAQALAAAALSTLLQQAAAAAAADGRRRLGERGGCTTRPAGPPAGTTAALGVAPLGRLLALQEAVDRVRGEVGDLILIATAGEEAPAAVPAAAAAPAVPLSPAFGDGAGAATNVPAAAAAPAAPVPAAAAPAAAPAAMSGPVEAAVGSDSPAAAAGGGGPPAAAAPGPAPPLPPPGAPAGAPPPAAAGGPSAGADLARQRRQVALEAQARYRRAVEKRGGGGDGSGSSQ